MTEDNSLDERSTRASDAEPWSADEIFGLCSNRDARIALVYLSDRETATIEELATVIAGQSAVEKGGVEGKERHDHARIVLHHAVLPRLADHDILEYDSEEGEVRDVDVPDIVATVLRIDG